MTLQADYITRQMQLFTEQARELGESTNKAAKDAATPRHWVPDCCRRASG